MSDVATAWAWAQAVPKASYKLVLLCLAEHHDRDRNDSFPSAACVCEETGLDKKTVRQAIKWLREEGFIHDTGRRTGQTKQVIVWEFHDLPTREELALRRRRRGAKADQSENGQVQEERGPFFPDKVSVFPQEGVRFSPERGPKTGHGITQEALNESRREGERVADGWLIDPNWTPPDEAIMQARRAGVPQSVIDDPRHLAGFVLKYREAAARDSAWSMRYVQWLINEVRGPPSGRQVVSRGTPVDQRREQLHQTIRELCGDD